MKMKLRAALEEIQGCQLLIGHKFDDLLSDLIVR